MAFIRVLVPGLQTTIQDLGRFGFAHLGVSPGGAADVWALRVGNRLVYNHENAAAFEMALVGGTFLFEYASFIALTGAACGAQLDGTLVPRWQSFAVRAGQTLACGAMTNGARTYLCIHGGIKITATMKSASTHLQTGIGGVQGRALKKNDALEISPLTSALALRPLRARASAQNYLSEKKLLRLVPGPQTDFFTPTAFDILTATPYFVSRASNRVGLRLTGAALARNHHEEMLTEGLSCGALQVPNDGMPIILFVEHPTTGGYPKIAHVISADLPRVGQLRPCDEVRFQLIPHEEARALFLKQQLFALQTC